MGKKALRGELKGLIQFKKLVLARQVVKASKWIQSRHLPRDLAQVAACQDFTAHAVCRFIPHLSIKSPFSVGDGEAVWL